MRLHSISGLGRSPEGGNGNPVQYSCPENPMDRGAWLATVYGVSKSRTRLRQLSTEGIVIFSLMINSFFNSIKLTFFSVYCWYMETQLVFYPALSLGGQATAWECSPGRSLCLTKSSACGRLWQFAHPRPLSLLQRGLAPRSKGKARAEL